MNDSPDLDTAFFDVLERASQKEGDNTGKKSTTERSNHELSDP